MTSRASGLLVNNESDNDLVLIPCTGTEKASANSQDVRGNPTDRGAWWVTVHRVTKSQTWLKQHTHTASLVAQLLKSYRQCRKLPAMQETWVWSLAWEDPLEEGMATHFSIPVCRIPQTRGAWWATFHGVTRVRHNLVIKPPPSRLAIISLVKRDKKIKLSVPK